MKAILTGHHQADLTLTKVEQSVSVLEQIIQAVGTIHQMNEQIARAAQSRAEWRTRSIATSATFAM